MARSLMDLKPRRLWLIASVWLVLGCEEDAPRYEHEIDAATFRQILQCGASERRLDETCSHLRKEAIRIESIRIEPRGSSARYVVTFRDRARPDVVYAEFPGKITDEITAAGIPYHVK